MFHVIGVLHLKGYIQSGISKRKGKIKFPIGSEFYRRKKKRPAKDSLGNGTVTLKPVRKLLRNTFVSKPKHSAKRPTPKRKFFASFKIGESTRHCKQNGSWNYPDYSRCSSEEFLQLKEKVCL